MAAHKHHKGLKFKLEMASLEKMYVPFVRPVLEYGEPIWDNCPKDIESRIESVQIEAMGIGKGATKLCSIAKLYEDVGCETLQRGHNKQKV